MVEASYHDRVVSLIKQRGLLEQLLFDPSSFTDVTQYYGEELLAPGVDMRN